MAKQYSEPFVPSDILRDVYLGDTGYRLTTWETGKRARTGQWLLGYLFRGPDGTVLFSGDDYGVSPMDAIDSDRALRGLLSFLTLQPGDTDDEYFAKYDARQMAFANREAEALQSWGMDDEAEYAPFVEV